VALVLALMLGTPALAGGWAVVTLDSLPGEVRAGTAYQIGFTVRQHGVTPISTDPFEGGPLRPVLLARNTSSGDKIEQVAQQQGDIGHFVASVTFPSAGEWEWEVVPPPFEGTRFAPLTVPAAVPAAAPAELAPVAKPILVVSGAALLGLAALLALLRYGKLVPRLRRSDKPL
jgi:hypothetical protein